MKKLVFFLMMCLPATSWSANVQYALNVKINPAEKKIIGFARLKANADIKLYLSVNNLKILKMAGDDIVNSTDGTLRLSMKRGAEVTISYEAFPNENRNNFIDKDNVFLTSDWYPQPNILAEYALSVTLPKNFTAVSEFESMGIQEHGQSKTIAFEFNHPLDGVHLAA